MNPRDILRAMGQIDESLIDEALETNGKLKEKTVKRAIVHKGDEGVYAESIIEVENPPKRKRNIFKWAGLAACLCVVVMSVALLNRSQLLNRLTPSSSPDTSDSEGACIVIDTEETEKPETDAEIDITSENNYNSINDGNKFSPDAVFNVPLAEIRELSIREEGYVSCSGINLSFIADNHSYFSTVSPTEEDNVYLIQLIGCDLGTGDKTVIFSERYESRSKQPPAFTPLCVYDGYIYLRREENTDFLTSEYWQNYSKAVKYTIWRIRIENGILENIADVQLALDENLCEAPVLDGYMYYESVVDIGKDERTYNINRIDLKAGYAEVFRKNARCPLVYDNKIIFYRDGTFYQCENDGSQTPLFNETIDFGKDRLAADDNNILLLRHCQYLDPSSPNKENFAFTAELYDKINGFNSIALFNGNVTKPDEFLTMKSVPEITSAGGRFEFLDIVFDPADGTFLSIAPVLVEESRSAAIIKWDDRFLYATYDHDSSVDEAEAPISNIRIAEF